MQKRVAAPHRKNVQASILHDVVEQGTVSAPAHPTIEALFAEHVRFVWRTLRHFGVADDDLEDVVQEVFIVAHRRLAEWDGLAPRGWLCAIARRCAAGSRRRSHRRHERLVESVPEGFDTRDPSARVELDRSLEPALGLANLGARFVAERQRIKHLRHHNIRSRASTRGLGRGGGCCCCCGGGSRVARRV